MGNYHGHHDESDNPWQHEFEAITPDVFPMKNFLEWKDYPRFLTYLIQSRQVDAVLIAGSQEAYRLLPYLRLHFPQLPHPRLYPLITPEWMDGLPAFVDVCSTPALDLSRGYQPAGEELDGQGGRRPGAC